MKKDSNMLFFFFKKKSIVFNLIYYICLIVYQICFIIGRNIITFFSSVGGFCSFFKKNLLFLFNKTFFLKNFLNSLFDNGFCSIPVAALTGFFTGLVLTFQLFLSLEIFGGINEAVPNIVLIALMKELGPVLCAIILVSRVGSSMSAEIGSMSINNQIDVLKTMSVSVYKFLYIPNILSMLLAQPILTIISVITGVIGSFIVSTQILSNLTETCFYNLIYKSIEYRSFIMCIIKSCVFGLIISSVACYKGSKTYNGAVGVRNTTISTVVMCCVFILIFNFLITWIFGKFYL